MLHNSGKIYNPIIVKELLEKESCETILVNSVRNNDRKINVIIRKISIVIKSSLQRSFRHFTNIWSIM